MRGAGAAALLTLGAALVGLVAFELRGLSDEELASPSPAPAGLPVQAGTAAAPASPRAQWVDTAVTRPLFNNTRRPISQPVAAATAVPAGLPRLAGVLVYGSDRSVILVPADGGRAVVARVGTEVSGVLVQSIQAGQVTVSGPDGTHVLRPTFDARSPTVVPALPATAGLAAPSAAFPGQPPLPAQGGFGQGWAAAPR